jgi:crotonobetainyl-CoA:carnitine CoA-transferase CaiB-like acyl-CoA transferase
MQFPLEDVKVLDLSHALAGPFCSTMLADYGAQIVKIEPPGGGDIARGWGAPIAGGETAYFVGLHRGKRGIVLDLKSPEGKEVFFKLVEQADVVLENYRMDALKRLGLDYEAAKKRNPGIIYCSISGFGQDGPYRERAALDLVVQAESGMISVTGEPGSSGTRAGVSIADLTAGMNAAYAIMLALRVKDKTGQGQHIDVSMLEGLVSLLSSAISNYFANGEVPKPLGTAYSVLVPYQTFRTKTKDIAIAVAGDKIWGLFCPAVGRPDLLTDPRFRTTPDRMVNRDALLPILQEALLARTYEEWEPLLLANDIPVGAINNVAQLVEHPQVKAREVLYDVNHRTAGKVRVVRSPIRLSKTPACLPTPSPTLGEHTVTVMKELGYSDAQIAELQKAGAFGKAKR